MTSDQLPDGIQRSFHANGKRAVEFTVKNGKDHGLFRRWHENRKLEEKAFFKAGVLDGLSLTWHDNGQLAREERFKDGLEHGTWRQWNREGKLLGSSRFHRGTGVQYEWHENGSLKSEASMVRGLVTGRMRVWAPDSMLYCQKYFFENRPISKKKYQAMCKHNSELPRFTDEKTANTPGNYVRRLRKERRERAKGGATLEELEEQERFDESCKTEFREAGSKEASSWLSSKKKCEMELGEMSKRQASNFVRKAYGVGATKVWATRIERDPDGGEYSKRLIIALPDEPVQQGKLYKLCADAARPFMTSGSPAIRVGRKYMSVSLL